MDEQQMQGIAIDEILAKPVVAIDLFLRLPSDKFLIVAKAGAATPVESITRYKIKNVTRMWVRKADYRRVVNSAIENATSLMATKGVSAEMRLNGIREAMNAVHAEFNDIGFNDEVFAHAKTVNNATIEFIALNPSLSDLIAKMNKQDDKRVKHAMMVSLISTMLGVAHDWTKPATLERLALGGFLHDIGMATLPAGVVGKKREFMSPDEQTIFDSHSDAGMQILLQAKSVPDDVLSIVNEHHELSDGSGFPQGLKDFQIAPLARLVSLANAVVEGLEQGGELFSAVRLKQAFEAIEIGRTHHFNKQAMKAMRRLIDTENFRIAG